MGCGFSSLTKGEVGDMPKHPQRSGLEGLPWPQADAGGSHTPLYSSHPFEATHSGKVLDDFPRNSSRKRAELRGGGGTRGKLRGEPQLSELGSLRALGSPKEDQESLFTEENSPLQSVIPSALHTGKEDASKSTRKLEKTEKSKIKDWLKKSVSSSGHSSGGTPATPAPEQTHGLGSFAPFIESCLHYPTDMIETPICTL